MATSQPTPRPDLLQILRHNMNTLQTDTEVLKYCLGLLSYQTPNALVNRLAEHIALVCIDTEHYTLNSDEMTELGISVLLRQNAFKWVRTGNLGEHGENLMREAKIFFYRLIEHTHMKVSNPRSKGAEGNRFGKERFVTFEEMRNLLNRFFDQPIFNVPELRGQKRPIVILGHAAGHDMSHLNGKDLAFDVDKVGTVVRVIDTQEIVREAMNWAGTADRIGLDKLVAKLGFTHSDRHTAANDVGRTLISAIQLVLPSTFKTNCRRSMQEVADEYELFTQQSFVPAGGAESYCSRCGSYMHKETSCTGTLPLPCMECTSRGLIQSSRTHVTRHCPVLRDEVAEERRHWYNAQAQSAKKPKDPYISHVQALAPNAPFAEPTSHEENMERRQWYMNQDPRGPLVPFVYSGRSYHNTMARRRNAPTSGTPIGSGYPIPPNRR